MSIPKLPVILIRFDGDNKLYLLAQTHVDEIMSTDFNDVNAKGVLFNYINYIVKREIKRINDVVPPHDGALHVIVNAFKNKRIFENHKELLNGTEVPFLYAFKYVINSYAKIKKIMKKHTGRKISLYKGYVSRKVLRDIMVKMEKEEMNSAKNLTNAYFKLSEISGFSQIFTQK